MNDDDHGAMILTGGARGCCPRSKHSMITMGLPQSGQIYVVGEGSGISFVSDAGLSMTLLSMASPYLLGANSNSLHKFSRIPRLVKHSILVTMIQ